MTLQLCSIGYQLLKHELNAIDEALQVLLSLAYALFQYAFIHLVLVLGDH